MSIEDKFHKLIQTHGQKERDSILKDIYAQMPELAPKSKPVKKRMSLRQKLFISMPIVAVGVCAAIVLPCVLIDNNPQTSIPTTYKYVLGVDYETKTENASTIKEYNEKQGAELLYFDWYEAVEEIITVNYVRKNAKEVLSIKENAITLNGEESITLAVVKNNFELDVYSGYSVCSGTHNIGEVTVKWYSATNNNNAMGFFEHNGYRYYITLEWSADENRLFELVNELLN